MIQYENDTTAIARAIAALEADQFIDHGTARAIAAGYNDSDTATFVTTGAIPDGDADALMYAMRRGVDAKTLESDADALNALEAYVSDRAQYFSCEHVPGWSDMWVPKHVDYPHEGGQLDTCWCFEDDDDTDA